MPTVVETVLIHADADAVFDLIARVEEFPAYAGALQEVAKIGPRTYRWTAEIGGITLHWDSIITEFSRPHRIGWRSIGGISNSGAYQLTPVPSGTLVSIRIDYDLHSRVLETLLAPLMVPMTRAAAADILANVKARLERGRLQLPANEIPPERSAPRRHSR